LAKKLINAGAKTDLQDNVCGILFDVTNINHFQLLVREVSCQLRPGFGHPVCKLIATPDAIPKYHLLTPLLRFKLWRELLRKAKRVKQMRPPPRQKRNRNLEVLNSALNSSSRTGATSYSNANASTEFTLNFEY
jgi:hypothetical protein